MAMQILPCTIFELRAVRITRSCATVTICATSYGHKVAQPDLQLGDPVDKTFAFMTGYHDAVRGNGNPKVVKSQEILRNRVLSSKVACVDSNPED